MSSQAQRAIKKQPVEQQAGAFCTFASAAYGDIARRVDGRTQAVSGHDSQLAVLWQNNGQVALVISQVIENTNRAAWPWSRLAIGFPESDSHFERGCGRAMLHV